MGPWTIRYQLAAHSDAVSEIFETKQLARDRFFTVREFKGLQFVELRNPAGKLWFRDHYFEGEHIETRNDSAAGSA